MSVDRLVENFSGEFRGESRVTEGVRDDVRRRKGIGTIHCPNKRPLPRFLRETCTRGPCQLPPRGITFALLPLNCTSTTLEVGRRDWAEGFTTVVGLNLGDPSYKLLRIDLWKPWSGSPKTHFTEPVSWDTRFVSGYQSSGVGLRDSRDKRTHRGKFRGPCWFLLFCKPFWDTTCLCSFL